MLMTQSFFKKILFLSAFVLVFTASNCDEVDIGQSPPSGTGTGTGVAHGNFQECQFYRVQSAIMSCYRARGFFTTDNPEQKKIIISLCVEQGFRSGLGVTLNNPYIPRDTQTGWSAWFVWGNIQAGNPPQASPTAIEQQYYHLLNAFKNSIDVNRFRSCLGLSPAHISAHAIITASEYLISEGHITSETFVSCYQEELELYKGQRACSVVSTTSQPPVGTVSTAPSTL